MLHGVSKLHLEKADLQKKCLGLTLIFLRSTYLKVFKKGQINCVLPRNIDVSVLGYAQLMKKRTRFNYSAEKYQYL